MRKGTVRESLAELGLSPAKSRGQNFLKDERVIAAILESVRGRAGDSPIFLEIGPGLGALTFPLASLGPVAAVEFDRGLAENLAKAARAGYPVTVIHQDILSLDPAPLAAERGRPLFVCGNLPYNISSQVILWFVRHLPSFSGAVFMLQKEMAERLAAEAGTKDYGRLTAALNLWCRAEKLFPVPPSAFHPPPKVESVIISITPRPAFETAGIKISPQALGRFTAAAFAARRKTILNNLARVYGRDRAMAALAAHGLPPGLRAETLSPGLLAALAEILEMGKQGSTDAEIKNIG